MPIKISCIIPTYNKAELCQQRALKSILDQTYKDYEIIVVDDCSPDNTEEIFKNMEGVRYFKTPRNMGVAGARNLGVKQAKGEYIVIVDDDNMLAPQFLEMAVETIERESAKEMKWSNSQWDALNTGRIVIHSGYKDYAPAYYQQGLGFQAVDWGWLIRKKVFDTIKYDEGLYGDEDADFGIQFYKNFRAYALDLPLQTAFADDSEK